MEGRVVRLIDPDFRSDDVVGGQRGPVMYGHDADHVVGTADHDCCKPATFGDDCLHFLKQRIIVGFEHEPVDPVAGDNDELGEIERVRSLAKDCPLRPLLPALGQKRAHIEKICGLKVAGKCLCGVQRRAVACKDIADLALRDRDQRLDVDAVLEGEEEMIAATHDIGLKTGFFLQRDQAASDRAAAAPQLLNDRDPVVVYVSHAARRDD